MVMPTRSCSSKRLWREWANGKWPGKVLLTGIPLVLLEIGDESSSVEGRQERSLGHEYITSVQLLEAERKPGR